MTDRIHSFTVVLDKDMREDDARMIAEAIRQLRGVLTVEANVAELADLVALSRVRRELSEKLWEVLFEKEHT